MKAVLPALNGPVTTILTVCIIAPRLMSRFRDPVNSGACLAPRLPEATGCDACPSGAPPASADFARPARDGSVFGGSGRLSLRPPETGHLDRPDAADQPLHDRRLFRLVDGRQLARLGREGHPLRPDDLDQPGLKQTEHDPADLHVAHLVGLGDLADGVLGIDVGDDLPLVDVEVDVADVGSRPLDEVEGHVQVWDLLDQLLVFLQLAGALHDDVLEVQAQGDAVLRWEDVVVEAEMAFVPGEQAVDAGQPVLAGARLARQVDQVEKLRDAKVTQVALDCHDALSPAGVHGFPCGRLSAVPDGTLGAVLFRMRSAITPRPSHGPHRRSTGLRDYTRSCPVSGVRKRRAAAC